MGFCLIRSQENVITSTSAIGQSRSEINVSINVCINKVTKEKNLMLTHLLKLARSRSADTWDKIKIGSKYERIMFF